MSEEPTPLIENSLIVSIEHNGEKIEKSFDDYHIRVYDDVGSLEWIDIDDRFMKDDPFLKFLAYQIKRQIDLDSSDEAEFEITYMEVKGTNASIPRYSKKCAILNITYITFDPDGVSVLLLLGAKDIT